jgi:hypothetical protein
MLNGRHSSAGATLAKAGIPFFLACVLAFSGEAQADPPKDSRREAKSDATATKSVKGMKLKVSPNGRYFVDQDGKSFFYLGDTAWFRSRSMSPVSLLLFLRPSQNASNVPFCVTTNDGIRYVW